MGAGSKNPADAEPATEYKLHTTEKTSPRDGDDEKEYDALWLYDSEEYKANNSFMTEELRNQLESRKDLTEEQKIIVQRLAMKSFHLPKNGYWEDWHQFVCNNHPIFSFCLADPLHPFGRKERILNLVASLAFGLAATCLVVLYFHNHDSVAMEDALISLGPLRISNGMFCLAFYGGFCNVLFDFGIWFLQACPPCQPGGMLYDRLSKHAKFFWIWLGSNSAIIVTVCALALAIHVMVLRASIEDDGDEEGISRSVADYAFVASFFMEVVVTQFIMFPIVAFTIFSGVLGCFGKVPGIGGRPYQVRKLQERLQKLKKEHNERGLSSTQFEI